uniref:Uncharacterized protein n=1 Tax=Arundo donax TaxID=35708 RepID=A0A0A9GQB8_ARUDO
MLSSLVSYSVGTPYI